MNERIKELVEQNKPKKEFWLKQLPPGVIFNAAWDKGVAPEDITEEFLEEHFPYTPALVGYSEIEKFAELIVRDCLYEMENTSSGDLDFAIWKIKKDYGIEQ